MCQSSQSPDAKPSESFPFHIPTYDAHCHPTDNMASMAALSTMKAAAMIIMATRSQDQQLVADVTQSHGIKSIDELASLKQAQPSSSCNLIPAFGWHPWFSHQLYDDTTAATPTYNPSNTTDKDAIFQAKCAHYRAVLQPPPEDDSFIASLPDPSPLSTLINDTRARLAAHPVAIVGEIGLDKPFRLPQQWDPSKLEDRDPSITPGTREGRLLSPYRVDMAHQQAILTAQLQLAGEMNRPVSVHGVQAPGILFDTISKTWIGFERHIPSRRERRLVAPGAEDFSSSSDDEDDEILARLKPKSKPSQSKSPYAPRVCLHSYSGSAAVLSQWMRPTNPADVYVSFSSAVNLGSESVRARIDDVIRAVPDDRVLVESDLDCAGDAMDAALDVMYRRVCAAKGWTLEDGVARIASNFEAFVFGKQK
ncbi:hypothetical protein VHEMI00548 [[Torrubiella] hemipterigena]|uniref:Cut9 interacting protein Scn1 n=1 Tax=[Torrubiella] hemipterigena TaxID=1531966 RepID=A0A0A1SJI8_9HYPO|nr:hypothetical protein VHEMI00548 [[Torrubiella] hemipterigena]